MFTSFTSLSIRKKLLLSFLVVGVMPLVTVAIIASWKSGATVHREIEEKFKAIQSAKTNHIEDYFSRVRSALKVLRDDPFAMEALQELNEAYENNGNTINNDAWKQAVKKYDARMSDIKEDNGWYDLFLIHVDGDIVYSVAKEADLGMTIPKSQVRDSGLGKAFLAMKTVADEAIVFADYEPYAPSNGAFAAFMMAKMRDGTGQVVGYAALQLPNDQINDIMQSRAGLGETGESYLVGSVNGVASLRSDRKMQEGKIGEAKTSPIIEAALKGQSGAGMQQDSTGKAEIAYYSPVAIEGATWCMVTTIAQGEALSSVVQLKMLFVLLSVVSIALIIALAWIVASGLVRPIQNTVSILKDIAQGEGDLTKRLNARSTDELGELARWFNVFIEKLQMLMRDIAGDAQSLSEASSSMSAVAGKLATGAEDMRQRSHAVASATEEMSVNLTNVASASEQASTNVNMVAAATEEMTATVKEIAQNSSKAREITEKAVENTTIASDRVNELGQAAREISKVTEVITEISEQTNLLALNATIEAARAGDAGKGFAVVANEIKELAKQTATATQEIKSRIEGIQNSTSDTVNEIRQISQVINEVNDIVGTIAAAVEEQSVSSQEIANNINQASHGIEEVNHNVNQSSAVSTSVSHDLTSVNQAIQEISAHSKTVNTDAGRLDQLASQLKNVVGRFKT